MSLVGELLAGHRMFKDMDPGFLRILRECAATADFHLGEFIFHQGRKADRFYILHHGQVALEQHLAGRGTLVVETAGTGDVLGSSWLFPPYRYQFDARCLEETRTLAFNAGCLRDICEADHDLGYELMKRFAGLMVRRLHAARLQCLDIYGNSGRQAQ
jgi:CRP-like cAMP-binding protein